MSFFHGKRIVVTGAVGFIGSHIVRLLRNSECEIIRVLRAPAAPVAKGGRARVRDVIGDVRDAQTWAAVLPRADVVFHLAAQTSAAVAEADPAADYEQNVLPVQLLVTARSRPLPVIVFASTITIAGVADGHRRVNESVPDDPITTYDRHKRMAEDCLRDVASSVSLRLANVYGPGPQSKHADRGVLNSMIVRALAGEPLTIYGAGDRNRDYVFVDDVARAFLAAARHAERIGGRHFVIGTGRGRTMTQAVRSMATGVARASGTRAPVRHVQPVQTPGPIEDRDYVADARAFRVSTGWKPRVGFPDGIRRTITAVERVSAR
jgi:nucleoside-diphosphate-sugar epimerase